MTLEEPRLSGDHRANIRLFLGIAVIAVAIRMGMLWTTHCTVEDALITLRYAENLAGGKGLIYNTGEAVQGATTPLFTLWLAVWNALGIPGLASGKALGILCDGVTSGLIAILAASMRGRWAGVVAGMLYAASSAAINFSIGGMESPVAALLGLLAIMALRSGNSQCVWIGSAVLALTRIDGLLLGGILVAAQTRRERKVDGPGVTWAAIILLPWVIYSWLTFGSPIPNSFTAKMTVYQRAAGDWLPNLAVVWNQWAGDAPHAILSSFALGGAVWIWKSHSWCRPALFWYGVYHLGMMASAAPVGGFGWYFVPPLPVYALAAGVGMHTICSRLTSGLGLELSRSRSWIGAASTLLICIALMANLPSIQRSISSAQALEDQVRRPLGEWLAANTPPDAVVLTEPIGYVGYYSKRRILDLVGLVSPEVLPTYRNRTPHPVGAIVSRFKPDYMALRPLEWEDILSFDRTAGDPPVAPHFEKVAEFGFDKAKPLFVVFRMKK